MLVGAFAIIKDEEGRFLISHRRDQDLWNLPGGGVEPGESPWDAISQPDDVVLKTQVYR